MNGSIGRRLAALEAVVAAARVGADPEPPARLPRQHALLQDAYVRVAWGIAAARWEREHPASPGTDGTAVELCSSPRGWRECTDADWSAAATAMHPAAGLDHAGIAAGYWDDGAAWVGLWRRDHAEDAATLALAGFGAAELRLLMEDGDDDGDIGSPGDEAGDGAR